MSSQPFPPIPPTPPLRGPDDTTPYTPISAEPVYAQPPVPVRRSGGAGGLSIALAVAVLIAGCGVSFAAGRATAPATATVGATDANAGASASGTAPGGAAGTAPGASLPNTGGQAGGTGGAFGGENGGEGFGRASFGGPSIQGTVESVTGNAVTVRLANGATVRVGLGPSTAYHQQTSGSQADLAAGKTVILRVNGRFGSDDQQGGGTLGTATDVTVVP
ncbi:MAG: hypothetical protein ACYDAN_09345 [Candidatus Limnocylindrales bacterium]